MSKKYKYQKMITYDGKRYAIRADTKEELAVKEYKKMQELESNRHIVSNNTTLSDWAMTCINTYKVNQNEVTRRKYVSRIKHCILDEIGHMKLKDIKQIHCQNVINLQIGKSKTQINEVTQALKFFMKKAVENNLIPTNPAEYVHKPACTHIPRRALTPTERQHVIAVGATNRKYYMFLLMLHCGCRPSEACECMGRDIVQMDGYNIMHIRGTKTQNADRYVPIPDELYELIKTIPKNEYIAVTGNGNQINENGRRRAWESFKRQLNLSMGCKTYRNQLIPPFPLAPDLVPYCFRHEYCTELARKGVDIRVAQKLMGHSDIQLTANIYTNLDNSAVIGAAKLLSESGKKIVDVVK